MAALTAQFAGVAVTARVTKSHAKRNLAVRAGKYDDELLETAVSTPPKKEAQIKKITRDTRRSGFRTREAIARGGWLAPHGPLSANEYQPCLTSCGLPRLVR
jgi:hypothetical protein